MGEVEETKEGIAGKAMRHVAGIQRFRVLRPGHTAELPEGQAKTVQRQDTNFGNFFGGLPP